MGVFKVGCPFSQVGGGVPTLPDPDSDTQNIYQTYFDPQSGPKPIPFGGTQLTSLNVHH